MFTGIIEELGTVKSDQSENKCIKSETLENDKERQKSLATSNS